MKTDQTKLQQILHNIVGNAVKFTMQGSIRILIEEVPDKENQIRFTVIDTGIGMSEKLKNNLFRMFGALDFISDSLQFGKNLPSRDLRLRIFF